MYYIIGYNRKAIEGKRTFCTINDKYKTIEEAKQAYCNYMNDDNKSFDLIVLGRDRQKDDIPNKPNDSYIIIDSWNEYKEVNKND